jgi:hypothetical protein
MTAQDKHNNDQWIGARPNVLIFDVNETLIDFEALNPLFERVFGDKRVLREWLGHPPAWTHNRNRGDLRCSRSKLTGSGGRSS